MASSSKIDEIVLSIRTEIAGLAPGTRFPTLRELMRRFGVSQLLVSQAMLILQREGLLESHVGRGTFVKGGGSSVRTVLWVCGIDLFHGEISPYYSLQLKFFKTQCAERGLSLDVAWISNYRPEDSAPLCTPSVLERYAGFIFVGCNSEHRFEKYILRNETVPSVCATFWPPHSRQVSGDFPQFIELGLSTLKSKGHRDITLLIPDGNRPHLDVVRETATHLDVRVRLEHYSPVQWAADYQEEGYRLMTELIKTERLAPGIFIIDDIVAQGATRALLVECSPERRRTLDLVVGSSKQSTLSLGLPVTYVADDIEDTVVHAVEILVDQIEGRTGRPDTYCSPMSVATAIPAAVDPAVASEAAPAMRGRQKARG